MWHSDLGYREYVGTLELQNRLRSARLAGKIPDVLILVEHPPVITLGSGAEEKHILASSTQLDRKGVAVCRTNRGGDVTYHGPGQLVGYLIFDLRSHNQDILLFLRNIEEGLIRALEKFQLNGTRKDGYTGVWIGSRKIAAIGIAVSRWVTMHGFALNVSTDLDRFSLIIPCGISKYGVTSMLKELNSNINLESVKKEVVKSFADVFSREGSEEISTWDLLQFLDEPGGDI